MTPMEYMLCASAEDDYLNALIDLLITYETPEARTRSILFCIRNRSEKCARTLVEKYHVRMPAEALLAAAAPQHAHVAVRALRLARLRARR